MGADNYYWSMRGRGEDEHDASMRAEHARFRAALVSIRDNRLSAAEAKVIATHALQDGHTTAVPEPCTAEGEKR